MSESKAQAGAQAMDWAWRGLAFVLATLAVNLGVACWTGVGLSSGSDFGGVFGLSSALFTGLAFAGLLYAVVLQRDEVQTAREALEAARDELKIARDNQNSLNKQLELQNEQTSRKTFEDTFFRMLAELDNIYEGIAIDRRYTFSAEGNQTIKEIEEKRGHSALSIIQAELMQWINISPPDRSIFWVYDFFYKFRRNNIGHYFRWIYYTLVFIHNNDHVDRKFYARLLRARLSDGEIALIAFNGLGSLGEDLMPFIEEYELLNNINEDNKELRVDILRRHYDDRAFRDPDA